MTRTIAISVIDKFDTHVVNLRYPGTFQSNSIMQIKGLYDDMFDFHFRLFLLSENHENAPCSVLSNKGHFHKTQNT